MNSNEDYPRMSNELAGDDAERKNANDLEADARALLMESDHEVRPLPQWEKDILASLERGFE
jgi:hypothetical protein